MNYQNINRREKAEVSMIKVKKMLQFAFILVALFWLLYQIYRSRRIRESYGFDDIEIKLRNERIGKLLGRRGGLGSSNQVEEDLYGVDLVEAAEKIRHEDEGDVKSNAEENYEDEYLRSRTDEEEESSDDVKGLRRRRRRFGSFLAEEGKTGEKVQHKKANDSTGDVAVQKLKSEKRRDSDEKVGGSNRSEVGTLVNFGAVILKSVDKKWEVFRFNDENGVPKHESAPSRRSNIQVESLFEQHISSSGNQSKDLEECQKLCLQNISDKKSSNKSEVKAVDEEIKETTTEVESGKESMRELLQKER